MRLTRWFYTIPLRLRSLFRRSRVEQEMDEEMRYHLEREIEKNIAEGLTPKEARYAAQRLMGGVEQHKEECRDMRRVNLIEHLLRDVQYALRQLRKNRGFAAVAIVTLALGIGANTAIFSLIDRVMLKPLPVRQPAELVELLSDFGSGRFSAFSYQALQYFRSHTELCSGIIAAANYDFHALIEGRSQERLTGQYVTGNYFPVLGVNTLIGRPLAPEDDRVGSANAVAVISHSVWQGRFGGDPDAIGKTLVLENVPFTVVGITAPEFQGLEVGKQVDVWVPLEVEPRLRRPSRTLSAANKWLQVIGRLKPGASLGEAQAELRVLFGKAVIEKEMAFFSDQALAAERVRNGSLSLEPAGTGLSGIRRQFSRPLLVLMAIVGVLLLIACTNVANLLFARAVAREKEIALRLSLGAGRARLIRQLLTESAVLAIAGGALSLLIGHFLSKYLAGFLVGGRSPIVLEVSANLATLGFTAAVAACTVVFFGLMPAFRSTDIDFASSLKGSAGWHNSKGRRLSAGLIVVQVALLTVLILGAGLFLRTLHNLNSIDLGFDPTRVLLVGFDTFGSGHSPEQLKALAAQLLERIEGLPGVRTVSLNMVAPIDGGGVTLSFAIGGEGSGRRVARNVYVNWVSARYFATLGTPIIAGRDFGPQDSTTTPRVVIVNQTFAHRYFGNRAPIGQVISQNNERMEIVGVVGDAKYMEIREAMGPTVYENAFQRANVPSQLLIRTGRDPETIAASVRAEVMSMMGNVLIRERTLEDHIGASIVRERLVATLAAFFGGLALLLGAIGLYGVVSNSVAARTREIGIRIALGIEPRRVVCMVLRDVLTLVGGGIVLGLPLAMLLTRFIASLLYGLAPDDPLTMLISVCSLLSAALLAAFVPARRASRVDPMIALRNE